MGCHCEGEDAKGRDDEKVGLRIVEWQELAEHEESGIWDTGLLREEEGCEIGFQVINGFFERQPAFGIDKKSIELMGLNQKKNLCDLNKRENEDVNERFSCDVNCVELVKERMMSLRHYRWAEEKMNHMGENEKGWENRLRDEVGRDQAEQRDKAFH